MNCSQLLTSMWSNHRRHSIRMAMTASVAKEGTTKQEIVTHSLSSTAASSSSSSSSTSSPTRVPMSPLSLCQNKSPYSNPLVLENSWNQKYGLQQYPASTIANVVEYSTQSNFEPTPTIICHGSAIGDSIFTKGTRQLSSHVVPHRNAYTRASAHRLITRKDKPTASGWKKPIVSSSLSLSSYVDPTKPQDTSTDNQIPLSLSSSLETTAPLSPHTVGVDMEELLKLASKKTTPLSLKDMYKYAIVDANNLEQRIRNAQFLHSELPVRVAQRAVDLLTLPHGLNEIPAVLQVAHVYLLYLEKFQDCPVPTDAKTEDAFTEMLQSMILERSSIPNAIARGVDAWMKSENTLTSGVDNDGVEVDMVTIEIERKRRLKEMEDALYRFFTARVGLRFLTEHHILSSQARAATVQERNQSNDDFTDEDKDSFLGCIAPNCCPTREVRKIVEAVRRQTMDYYGDGVCPEIEIVNGDIDQNKKNNFTYVPHHLHYMVGELLKNSCRATVKRHIESGATNEKIPPIKIVIVKGAEDVTIKIADRGGGIPRSQMSEIWQFAHSTAAKDEIENETDFGVCEITGEAIRGFGLPLARVYARYLGGELTLKSLEGYGLDAYLHLPRLGANCENLPLPVQFSPSNLNSNPLRTSTMTDDKD